MKIHIQNRCREQFGGHKTLVELACIVDLLDQAVGNHFSGLIVTRVGTDDLRLVAIVLHKLAGQFDEVARRVGTAKTLVVRLAEQAVKGVTKLMEECLDIVHREERRVACGGFVEVTHIDDDGTMVHAFCVDILRGNVVHPSTRTFTGTREIVGIEESYQRTVGFGHLKHLYLRVIHRHVVHFLKIDTIQCMRQIKGAFAYIVQFEIGLQLLFVEVIFLCTQFLGIVPPVPRLKFLARQVFVHHLSRFERRSPNRLQELIHRLVIFGHTVSQDIICGIVIAE